MRDASAAFSDLNQCLIGETNTTGEEVVVKFRHHQVAMMGRTGDQRTGDAGEAWPERCESYWEAVPADVSAGTWDPELDWEDAYAAMVSYYGSVVVAGCVAEPAVSP